MMDNVFANGGGDSTAEPVNNATALPFGESVASVPTESVPPTQTPGPVETQASVPESKPATGSISALDKEENEEIVINEEDMDDELLHDLDAVVSDKKKKQKKGVFGRMLWPIIGVFLVIIIVLAIIFFIWKIYTDVRDNGVISLIPGMGKKNVEEVAEVVNDAPEAVAGFMENTQENAQEVITEMENSESPTGFFAKRKAKKKAKKLQKTADKNAAELQKQLAEKIKSGNTLVSNTGAVGIVSGQSTTYEQLLNSDSLLNGINHLLSVKSYFSSPLQGKITGATPSQKTAQVNDILETLRRFITSSEHQKQILVNEVNYLEQQKALYKQQTADNANALFGALSEYNATQANTALRGNITAQNLHRTARIEQETRVLVLEQLTQSEQEIRDLTFNINANKKALSQGIQVVNGPIDPFKSVVTPEEWQAKYGTTR